MIWQSHSESEWRAALEGYARYLKPENVAVEHEFENLDMAQIQALDDAAWFEFLKEKYFKWKYTAANRYASTTLHLQRYVAEARLGELHRIKRELFALDRSDIRRALQVAKQIHGLGVAGASGLLAVLFPADFGTADQFVVKALREVPDLPEGDALARMNPKALTLKDGILLIQMMRAKAAENNHRFGTDFWTPRRIDMVLWATRQEPKKEKSTWA